MLLHISSSFFLRLLLLPFTHRDISSKMDIFPYNSFISSSIFSFYLGCLCLFRVHLCIIMCGYITVSVAYTILFNIVRFGLNSLCSYFRVSLAILIYYKFFFLFSKISLMMIYHSYQYCFFQQVLCLYYFSFH